MLCAAKETILLWPMMGENVLSLAADLLAADPAFAETHIPQTEQLAENSRQGFGSTNRASHPGKIAANSTTALGVSCFRRSQTAVGSRVVYDGDGNRVSETVGGTTTNYLVDALNPAGLPQVMDEVVNNAVTRTYAYGLQRISEDQQIGGAWTPSFYGYDGHGNVRFLTNNAGTVTDSYDYDAFGMPITTTGTTPNNFLYSGEQYDSTLGLYYLRARYYNLATGRFLTMDPRQKSSTCYSCGRSTSNSYTYASANPVNRIDPRGLVDVLEEAEIAKETVLVVHPVVWGTYAVGVACLLSSDVSYIVGILQNAGTPIKANPCLYRFKPNPDPTGVGNCTEFVTSNCKPPDQVITYRTIKPAASCGDFGYSIFSEDLNGQQISTTGLHQGVLRNGTVFDSIYPQGIPLSDWEGRAYTVPINCSFGYTSIAPLAAAAGMGIGEITIK